MKHYRYIILFAFLFASLLTWKCLAQSRRAFFMQPLPVSGGAGGGGATNTFSASEDGEFYEFPAATWNFSATSATPYMGEEASDYYWGWFTFVITNGIPDNAIITAGTTISIYGNDISGWQSANDFLAVYAEDAADASALSGVGDRPISPVGNGGAGDTPLTTANVRWPESGGLTWNEAGYNTRDITSVIQELVDDNNGLASNAKIRIWVARGAIVSDSRQVGWNSIETGSNTPQLTIGYTP